MKTLMVTGGAGFIGVNFIRYVLSNPAFEGRIVNVDCLTYAGNLLSLKDVEEEHGGERYVFERVDIGDSAQVEGLLRRYDFDGVVHLAAESHVDRSIDGPGDFIRTNIVGTFNLLEACRKAWDQQENRRFHHVSTDEVYGSLGAMGKFTEDSSYDPRSPYSASKASSDHLVRAYYHTYGLDITITNCSNNYGPYQFPEKLIPLMIANMLEGLPLPVYGDGRNVRDWIYVEDHAEALWLVLTKGTAGATYNVGGECELANLDLVKSLCETVARLSEKSRGKLEDLITFVKDRPGHDRRYAVDSGRIRSDLGWRPTVEINEGLERTVGWYLANEKWVRSVKSGEYRKWIEANYLNRA